MAIIKCKMCGGDLEVVAESRVAVCEYCGTQQTVPSADNEKKLTLFGRANRLRMACEFDKAAGVYESIVADFPEEAEAYWGLVLCKYGIEYVDDPATGKKIPTCHRSSFDSVMDDSNLEQALENADAIARRVYRDEAKAIEDLRKGIIEVSGKEEPYDIFICYKETDDNGDRTIDSVIAQEVYDALTEKGYRVFFSRITLEDKLGQEYEPYIFAALHSAKIMLAFGTDYEYYNAVWVKNEWSRFLQLIAAGEKKTLIPCYKNIDAYDMPKEFARLQAQDMGKVGAMQDLLRGIEKILPREKQVVKETVVVQQSGGNNKVQALLDRGNMALEDGEWAKADGFFEEVLNNDAKCAWAYVGKTLAQERCKSLDAFVEERIALAGKENAEEKTIPADEVHIQAVVDKYTIKNFLTEEEIRSLYLFDLSYMSTAAGYQKKYFEEEAYWNNHKLLSRAVRFAEGEETEVLRAKERVFSALNESIKAAECEEESACQDLQARYAVHIAVADGKAAQLYAEAEGRRENYYQQWAAVVRTGEERSALESAAHALAKLDGYKDSQSLISFCNERIDEVNAEAAAEAEAILQAQAAEEARLAAIKAEEDRFRAIETKKRAAKRKKIAAICAVVAVVAIAAIVVVTKVVIPNGKYNDAVTLMEAGEYKEAIVAFETLVGYKDSDEKIGECHSAILNEKYRSAIALMDDGQYEEAITALEYLEALDYKGASEQIENCKGGIYNLASVLTSEGAYEEALTLLSKIEDYKDVDKKIKAVKLAALKNCKVGDIVTFGNYEQDNNTANGKEPIEWRVLDIKDKKALVLSEQILDCKQYESSYVYTEFTWETCSLRNWLSHGFFISAFSNVEQDLISKITVSADNNPTYPTNPGNSTKDTIFLLSISEVNQYLGAKELRVAKPTDYAKAQVEGKDPTTFAGSATDWWLRTPGDSGYNAAYVGTTSGTVFVGGRDHSHYYGIRPAMWIDLNE